MSLSGPPLNQPVHLPQLLHRGLEAKPDDPALVSAEARRSWRELDQASERLAANLLSLGLRAGDRVASLMPNRTALVVHYLACMKAGLVATPLNYRYMPPEIDHALEVSGASLLLAHAERDRDLAASRRARRLPLGVISYGASDRRTPSFEELTHRTSPNMALEAPGPNAPAVIFLPPAAPVRPRG